MNYILRASVYPYQCIDWNPSYHIWDSVDSIYTFVNNRVAPRIEGLIIRNGSKITDLINCVPFGLSKGLLISDKLLGILQTCNIPNGLIDKVDAFLFHKDRRIIYNGIYYKGLFFKSYVDDYIDLKHSIFEFQYDRHLDEKANMIFKQEFVKFDNFEQLSNFKNDINNSTKLDKSLSPSEIYLKRADFDFIVLPEISISPIVSENFKKKIEENKITGISFEPLDGKNKYIGIQDTFILGNKDEIPFLKAEKERFEQKQMETERLKAKVSNLTPKEEWNQKSEKYLADVEAYFGKIDLSTEENDILTPLPEHQIDNSLSFTIWDRIKDIHTKDYILNLAPMWSVLEYGKNTIKYIYIHGKDWYISTARHLVVINKDSIVREIRKSKWMADHDSEKLVYQIQKKGFSILDEESLKEIEFIEMPKATYNITREYIQPQQVISLGKMDRWLLVSSDGIYIVDRFGNQNLFFPEADVLIEKSNDLDEDEKDQDLLYDIEGELPIHISKSKDGNFFVIGSPEGNFWMYDVQLQLIDTFEMYPSDDYPDNMRSVFSNDNKWILLTGHVAGDSQTMIQSLLDRETEPIYLKGLSTVKYCLPFLDGFLLGDQAGCVTAFNTNGKCIWREYIGAAVSYLFIHQESNQMVVGTYLGSIHLYSYPNDCASINDSSISKLKVGIIRNSKELYWWD